MDALAATLLNFAYNSAASISLRSRVVVTLSNRGAIPSMRKVSRAPVSLQVTAAQRQQDGDRTVVTHLHGINKGKHWCLSMEDAYRAVVTGMYALYVLEGDDRRKLGPVGHNRLEALGRNKADLLLTLPEAAVAT